METATPRRAFYGLLRAIAEEHSILEVENASLRSRLGMCENVADEWDEWRPALVGERRAFFPREGASSANSMGCSSTGTERDFHGICPVEAAGYHEAADVVLIDEVAGPAQELTCANGEQLPDIRDSSVQPLSGARSDVKQIQLSATNADLDPQLAIQRVSLRLGISSNEHVTALHLHRTMRSLGGCKFALQIWDGFLTDVHKAYGVADLDRKTTSEMLDKVSSFLGGASFSSTKRRRHTPVRGREAKVTVATLVNAMSASQESNLKRMSAEHVEIIRNLRNVLFACDTNLLIAELTHVQVDDLCSSIPMDAVDQLEPAVAVAVILNGFVIGWQADKGFEHWLGWEWTNAAFTFVFLLEFLLRLSKHGLHGSMFGREKFWNMFDIVILSLSLLDIVLTFLDEMTSDFIGVLRILRICRLMRLVRVFRLRIMRDLTIMVMGLLSGLKTLFWAFILLFVIIYILAVCMVTVLKDDAFPREHGEPWQSEWPFSSVSWSMLVIFRCFTGDCVDGWGCPLVQRFTASYGWPFVVAYLMSFVLVSFGLFNLIVGLYVENTLAAGRMDDAANKRLAVKIAHKTRELLAKFCLAQATCDGHGLVNAEDVQRKLSSFDASKLNVEDNDMVVTKEVFLLAIQDEGVQKLMDDLDIPSDRAYLFDIFDTQRSGQLLVTELVYGLLKVRGGPKKSDIVAVLLAVQATQRQVVKVKAILQEVIGETVG
eukprot:TRINITY_DN52010_c0_g1_i1.p1 TRINITY_DN52010_c0_g1~~TRINITY_DN52010_c0_g1_i1.p1  ORF type:complete len:715 (-),score=101.67 TRINITY_DN52010_c0_g1_i1:11-2155(-)